jgi:hypothetical protein
MAHYTVFHCLKGDKHVSTTTLLVAKWFVYVIDRTDCILYYRLVEMRVQSEKCTFFYFGVVGMLPCFLCFFGCVFIEAFAMCCSPVLTVYKLRVES